MPTVVHCKLEQYTHYIGRPSKLGNKYSRSGESVYGVIKVDTVAEAIRRFEEDTRKNKYLMDLIKALPEDAVLGCWCKPGPCHGDSIVKIWNELHGKA